MTFKEIVARRQQINAEVEKRSAELTAEEIRAFNDEIDTLQAEEQKINQADEARSALLDKIAKSKAGISIRKFSKEEEASNGNVEYRSAFLKTLQGNPLTEMEQRALSTIAADKANLPMETQTMLVDAIETRAPLLNEIDLLHVNGPVTFYVGDVGEATIHTEGEEIESKEMATIKVDLNAYEILKGIQISKAVKAMTVQAFENWLVKHLSIAIARGIQNYIVNGTGVSQPKGLNAITWNETNSVTNAAPTVDDVLATIGLLPSEYDMTAKWLMSKKTLFTDFMPLKDKNKHDIVRDENGKYFVLGYEAVLVDQLASGAILGDLKMMAGNLSSEIEVTQQYNINNNTIQFLGVATFDCKPAVEKAFVKLKKA